VGLGVCKSDALQQTTRSARHHERRLHVDRGLAGLDDPGAELELRLAVAGERFLKFGDCRLGGPFANRAEVADDGLAVGGAAFLDDDAPLGATRDLEDVDFRDDDA
jgi:hypothetical protein